MKKRVLRCLAATAAVACLAAAGGVLAGCNSGPKTTDVAMVTDYGGVNDQSFNQSTYEACKSFCKENELGFTYYKPSANTTAGRNAAINRAIAKGYKVIVLPGYSFAESIVPLAGNNPDVKFVGLDVSAYDLYSANGEKDYDIPSNVVAVTYSEQYSGFMAGYAAVKEGYKKLGFLGGMEVPAVQRFGWGYVQGADAAAAEDNIEGITVKYQYSGVFEANGAIKTVMDAWYSGGTEVVFACGGGIFKSVGAAAKDAGVAKAKVIGVDTDQKEAIDKAYGAGCCITSAMKGLGVTVDTILGDHFKNNGAQWTSTWGGKVTNFGIASADPDKNFVQLPTANWSMTKFTLENYKTLVGKLYNNEYTVLAELEENARVPETTKITVDFVGSTIV